MAPDPGEFSVRTHLPILREALQLATSGDGKEIDKFVRAALGYFILKAAREDGLRDPAELARAAISCLEADPTIVNAFTELVQL